MSNDILDRGSSGRRIIILLTLLLLLISALIFLFNRDSFLRGGKPAGQPVVIEPSGPVKTFPDSGGQNGQMPPAKVYDMLQQTPPSSQKKPTSVKDIINGTTATPEKNTGAAQKNTPAPASTSAAQKNTTTTKGAASKGSPSVADLVSKNESSKTATKDNGKDNAKANKNANGKDNKNTTGKDNKNTTGGQTAALPAVGGGSYILQMASFTDEASAQKFLGLVKSALAKITGGGVAKGLTPRVASGQLANGQKVYRSQIMGFATKAAAQDLCQKLQSTMARSSKPDCLVLKSS